MNKLNTAIILLENHSTKMFPFDNVAISLLKIKNKHHIVSIIETFKANKIDNIYIIGNYKLELIKHLLSKYENIKFIEAFDNTKSTNIYNILKENNTLIYDIKTYVSEKFLTKFIKSYKDENIALNAKLLDVDNSKHFICSDSDEYVNEYFYAPRRHYVNAKSAGVFILNKTVSNYFKYDPNTFLNVNVGVIAKEGFYVEQILNDILKEEKILAYYTDDSYVSLNFVFDLLKANINEVKSLNIKESVIHKSAHISPNAIIKGNVIIGENTIIGDNVIIGNNVIVQSNTVIDAGAIILDNVIIGNGSIINNYAKINSNSVIGDNNKIGYNAEVFGVTFDNVAIVHNSHIAGLIGNNVDIGAGSFSANLRFDDKNQIIKTDFSNFFSEYTNNIFIGNNTRLAIGVLINVGVRIGENCAVGANVFVDKDLAHNKLIINKNEVVIKEWGKDKHEIL